MVFLSSSHWLRLLRFCAKCDFYLKPPTNNFQSTKFLIHMRWDIEEGCLGQTIRWNAVMASSNRGNSCCYYWLARSNGRTCTIIAVIYLESLVWFAFWLLKCSLKHHYVSFWSYYFYIIFFSSFKWPIVVIVEIVIRWIKVSRVCNDLLFKIWWLVSIWFQEY